MRRRLVEGVTPGALAPAPPVPPPAAGTTPPRSLAGRWYGRDRSVLEIRGAGGRLEWDWELVTDRVTMRATGTGSAPADQVSLVGRSPASCRAALYSPSRSPSPGMGPFYAEPPPARTTYPVAWSSRGTDPERIDLLE